MFRLDLPFINIDSINVAESEEEVNLCIEHDDTYIYWTKGKKALQALVLRPMLEKHLPGIDWTKIFGLPVNEDVNVLVYNTKKQLNKISETTQLIEHSEISAADVANKRRIFKGGNPHLREDIDIYDYIGNTSTVDIDMLLSLKLLPTSLYKIVSDMIEKSMELEYVEKYNKKTGMVGGFENIGEEYNNLLIIDVSNSIPLGISSTMLALASTMKKNLSADIIITGSNSQFWRKHDQLPDPNHIRHMIGRGNESIDFNKILRVYVSKKHWSNIWSFGDKDEPCIETDIQDLPFEIDNVYHFHTWAENKPTGYARYLARHARHVEYDTTWCDFICKDE